MLSENENNKIRQDIIRFLNELDRSSYADLYQKTIYPHSEKFESNIDILIAFTPKFIQSLAWLSDNPTSFAEGSKLFLDGIKNSRAYKDILFAIWSNHPDKTVKFITDLDEVRLNRFIRKMEFKDSFYYEIGPPNDRNPIYFLYDRDTPSAKRETYDNILDLDATYNGDTEFYSRDYLSWPGLFHIYFPDRKIILTSDKTKIPDKYIYILTFNYFKSFIEQQQLRNSHSLPIDENILKDAQIGKALILWNDSHEYSNIYKNKKWWNKALSQKKIAQNSVVFTGDFTGYRKINAPNRLFPFSIFQKSNQIKTKLYAIRYFEEALKSIILYHYPNYSFNKRYEALHSVQNGIKHFLCLNNIIKDYRVTLSYLFYKNNFLETSYISQKAFNGTKDFQFNHNSHLSMKSLIDSELFEKFRASLPWVVDTKEQESGWWNTIPIKNISRSFVWVNTETEFGSYTPKEKSFITEKTYKPIAFFMPFIMVGPPLTLQTLREEGYQTFSKWWDESYDKEVNSLKRMKKIEALLIEISKWSRKKLLSVTLAMKDVLEHNHRHLLNVKRSLPSLQAVLDLYHK